MQLHQIAIAIFVLCNYGLKVSGYKCESGTCGRRLVEHEPLIVDGNASKEGEWPWHASLLHIDVSLDIHFKCGGTLLNSNAILTAAHCVYENGQPIVPYRVLIQLGRNNLKIAGPNSKEFEAFRIIPHPDFKISNLRNDIAIVLLATEVTFNDYIQPICLWNADKTDLSEVIGKQGTVVGFGVTKTDQIANTLQHAVMPVVSLGTCLGSNNDFYGQFLSDFTFCAGSRNGTTACNGDSGGSLIFQDKGIYRIRGIVSLTQVRPGERKELCKIDEYVVFTDVAKYLSWIEENVLSVPSLPLPSPSMPSIEVTTQKHKETSNDSGGITSQTLTWNGNWALGCEFKGNDLTSVKSRGAECGGLCTADPQCTHFTWINDRCWLKQNRVSKTDASVSEDKSAVCGVIFEMITWNENWALGCEFRGNDLTSVKSTGEDCGGLCADTAQCTHFTWNSETGTCWLKQNAVRKSDALASKYKSTVCGVISETLTWNGNWALGCDFRGNDLKSVPSTGAECGEICAANTQCTHFTWNNGTCWLKQYDGVTKDDAIGVSDMSIVCGVIRGRV